ncbi:ComF family protein [Pontixanthobacter gangjinensis]|uniref:ComF family protein n=1 Tax=Pontixanthobacter gangjinensis TaxID=1028742 RepID=UPI002E255F51
MAHPPRHDGIASATVYNDTSRKLILSFKHGKRIALANMLSKLMAARLPELEGEWLFIPVPLHRTRLWSRGFNQSALLARQIAKIAKCPLLVDGLIRTKRTKALGGLGKKARERMLQGSMVISRSRKSSIIGANIVLVDDVFTSGATSDACVKALRQGGANKVLICCFARVLDEELSVRRPERETPEV